MSTITKTPIIITVLAIASLFVAGPVSTNMGETKCLRKLEIRRRITRSITGSID